MEKISSPGKKTIDYDSVVKEMSSGKKLIERVRMVPLMNGVAIECTIYEKAAKAYDGKSYVGDRQIFFEASNLDKAMEAFIALAQSSNEMSKQVKAEKEEKEDC